MRPEAAQKPTFPPIRHGQPLAYGRQTIQTGKLRLKKPGPTQFSGLVCPNEQNRKSKSPFPRSVEKPNSYQ